MEGGFGLYIHWPFCQAKCPYCDFNSHVSDQIDMGRWARAYLSELNRMAEQTPGRILDTVFFGGGTPSLMSPDLVAQIIARIRALWPMGNNPEITLEANPTSVEAGKFRAFREAGVSRVSMGIQALNDIDLRKLGRMHSAAEALAAFEIARDTFDRVSFDLIHARQDQTLEAWRAELTRAMEFAVDHLSLYQLTIEPETAFGARHAKGGLRGLPSDDLSADMYDLTQEVTEAHGMPAYETSNHAREGAESRHNLIYWRSGDWIGVGPGAHGRLSLDGQRVATEALHQPGNWLAQVEDHGHGETPRQVIPPEEQATEYLMMSMRLREGTDINRFEAFGSYLPEDRLTEMQETGFITRAEGRLCATAKGRPVLNAILRELLVD